MYLTRHQTLQGPRWAVEGGYLPSGLNLSGLLELPRAGMIDWLHTFAALKVPTEPHWDTPASVRALAPIDPSQEVWAAGVTYLRSRDARQMESKTGDIYERVYNADRPELFFKAIGWRAVGPGDPVRIRRDSRWNVPEPELTLVIDSRGEIVGFCVGNDVSSREIEGENPLYLPQAKVYNGSCALGPGILLADIDELGNLPITMEILRSGSTCFIGETRTSQIARPLEELAAYLFREMDFPGGVLLMTGTGIVPPDDFTLQAGDVVYISIGSLTLENEIVG